MGVPGAQSHRMSVDALEDLYAGLSRYVVAACPRHSFLAWEYAIYEARYGECTIRFRAPSASIQYSAPGFQAVDSQVRAITDRERRLDDHRLATPIGGAFGDAKRERSYRQVPGADQEKRSIDYTAEEKNELQQLFVGFYGFCEAPHPSWMAGGRR
jgi:hypothetical protein